MQTVPPFLVTVSTQYILLHAIILILLLFALDTTTEVLIKYLFFVSINVNN